MERWFGLDDEPRPPSVVAIGVFDGVHRGHRSLIRIARAQANEQDLGCTVLTFDPNPAEVVGPAAPARISTLAQRLQLFEQLGVAAALVLPFDTSVAQMSPRHFFESVLLGGVNARAIVVGENFRFGYRASGDVAALREFGGDGHIKVTEVPLVREHLVGTKDVPLSSTEIRALIAAGDVSAATRGLARPHRVEGTVVVGERRGRELGYPTANLQTTELAAVPADGVYAGNLVVDPYSDAPHTHPAAISVGTNPTFGDEHRRVEAYALDLPADTDIYGAHVAVDFVGRLRGQQSFGSVDALVTRMARDVAATRRVLGLA